MCTTLKITTTIISSPIIGDLKKMYNFVADNNKESSCLLSLTYFHRLVSDDTPADRFHNGRTEKNLVVIPIR